MAQFMIMLNDTPETLERFAAMSPDEVQHAMERYFAWNDQLEREGRLRGGEKLMDGTARFLRRAGERLEVSDGPFSETKEVLGGFYMIEAADYEEAVEIAKGCPQLDYGGSLEVREVDPITAPTET